MDERHEVIMKIDGLAAEGCADGVRRAIRGLDPEAEVDIDADRGRITVMTRFDTLEVADALTKAGYNTTGVGNV
jgi:copper chaperone